jgi:hypothetical protein
VITGQWPSIALSAQGRGTSPGSNGSICVIRIGVIRVGAAAPNDLDDEHGEEWNYGGTNRRVKDAINPSLSASSALPELGADPITSYVHCFCARSFR